MGQERFVGRPRQFLFLARETAKEWIEDKSPKTAAALAYYSLFAIGPLLLIATGLAGLVFGHEAARSAVTGQVAKLLGEQAGEALAALMAAGFAGRTGFIAVAVGAVVLVVGALAAFAQLREGLNLAWEVETKPVRGLGAKLRQVLRQNLLSFAGVLGLGFLLLVSLAVSTAVTAVATRLSDALPGADALWQAANVAFMLAVAATVFTLIFRFLPDARVAWRDTWVGGSVTAVLFVAGEILIGLYLGGIASSSRYGAAGAVPILLLWLYYSSLIVLFGAELTQVYANRFGSRVHPSASALTIQEATIRRHAVPSQEGTDGGPAPPDAPLDPAKIPTGSAATMTAATTHTETKETRSHAAVAGAEFEFHARAHRAPVARPERPPRIPLRERFGRARRRAGRATRTGVRRLAAVAQTVRLAARAPRIAGHARQAASSWMEGQRAGLVLFAVGGVLALFFLGAFTAFAIVGLDMLLGAPWGALVVALVYAVAAGVCVGIGLAQRRAARRKAEEHLAAVRREVEEVVRPVREAWANARAPPPRPR